jgi:hypothetical protein
MGHAGAGNFANDIVVLDEQYGFHVATIPSPQEHLEDKKQKKQQNMSATTTTNDNDDTGTSTHQWSDGNVIDDDLHAEKYEQPWPCERGWAASDSFEDTNRVGHFYMFGGLTGNDDNPTRLNDLWKLEVSYM